MKHNIKILLACLIAFTPAAITHAASMVKAIYRQGTNTVAVVIYTGPDGGPASDPAPYWELLTKAPQAAYEVKITPDQADGKTATLEGNVSVSIEIRNKFDMGTAKTTTLTLVRNDSHSGKWYIPAKELKRIQALITRNVEKKDEGSRGDPAKE